MSFDASEAAAALRKAMKGWGADEDTMIEMICGSSVDQVRQIREAYNADLGRDLIKDVKSECGGHFEDVLVGLLQDRDEFDAINVHKACKGMGTNETIISEILCTRTADEITRIRATYNAMYGEDMLTRLEDETGGDLQKTYNLLITRGAEVKDEVDDVDGDVAELYAAGEGKWGANEGVFIRKICGHTREYCTKLYFEYAKKHGKALDDVIKDEIGGDCAEALAYLVTPIDTLYAKKMYKSMHGFGTDDSTLIRCVVSQRERNLFTSNEACLREYKRSLSKLISMDCSGDYKKALVKIVELEIARGEAARE